MGTGLTIAGAIIGMNVGILCLVASMSLLLVGYTFEQQYVAEFVDYKDALCTIVDFKVVSAATQYSSTGFVAVAGVTMVGNPTVFAAVKQANTTLTYSSPVTYTEEYALNTSFPANKFQRDVAYPCGVPADGLLPATFASVTEAPFERAVAMAFDREAAQAYAATPLALIIAGWVCIGLGLFCLPMGIFLLCGKDCCDECCECCECCEDYECCECSCSCDACCDRYEEYKLNQRIANSRRNSPAAKQHQSRSPDFDDEGNLTHYTCEYGIGHWCAFFGRELAGKKPVVHTVEPTWADVEAQRMEKGDGAAAAQHVTPSGDTLTEKSAKSASSVPDTKKEERKKEVDLTTTTTKTETDKKNKKAASESEYETEDESSEGAAKSV
jgi:hypothetical protein